MKVITTIPRRFCSRVTVGLQVTGRLLLTALPTGTAHARTDSGVTSSSADVTRTSMLVVPIPNDDLDSSTYIQRRCNFIHSNDYINSPSLYTS